MKQVAGVQILKIAAAQRQLDSAIRMAFMGEDALAIATIASAACRLLRDLMAKRGANVLADQWRDNLLAIARSLVRNELSEAKIALLQQHGDFWEAINVAAVMIREAGADRRIVDLRRLTTNVSVPAKIEKQHWREFDRVANFLKHADKDPDDVISEREIDTYPLLLTGCGLYQDLTHRLTPEMWVWMTYELHVKKADSLPGKQPWRTIAVKLRAEEPQRRGRAALELVRMVKESQARARTQQ